MFKKLFILLLTLFAVSFAAAPSITVQNGFWVVESNPDTFGIDTNGAFDTITSSTDSSTLITGLFVKPGYTYILTRDAFTGTAADGSGTDSVKIAVNIDALDENSNLIHRFAADSFTAAAGEAVVLPFYQTVFGENGKWRIKLKGYSGSGSQVILNRFYLWRVYPATIRQQRMDR